MLSNILKRLRKVLLWALVRNLGSARELDRIRAYLETGLDVTSPAGTNALQRSDYGYFPGLSAYPWHDPAEIPWTKTMLQSLDTIVEELETIRALKGYRPGQLESMLTDTGSWELVYLLIMGKKSKAGHLLCPKTTSLMGGISDIKGAGVVFFSSLAPGSHVNAHCDGTNTRLRLHLGLVVPTGCSIRVAEERRTWEEGKFLLFDGSFEHEVWNQGPETRWVLIVDIWHPELTQVERRALTRLSYVRSKERMVRRVLQSTDHEIFCQVKVPAKK